MSHHLIKLHLFRYRKSVLLYHSEMIFVFLEFHFFIYSNVQFVQLNNLDYEFYITYI